MLSWRDDINPNAEMMCPTEEIRNWLAQELRISHASNLRFTIPVQTVVNMRFFILCMLAACYQFHANAAETNLIVEINPKGPAYSPSNPVHDINLLAAGSWSESISDSQGNRLRGRLVVYDGIHQTNALDHDVWTTAPVYLEIQDVTTANQHPTRIYFDLMEGLTFELRDAKGATADNLPHHGFRGGIPRLFWATLPARGLLRLRADAENGISVGSDGELRLYFLDVKGHQSNMSWTIPVGDTYAWFLSATLLPLLPATNSIPYNPDVWQGALEFPAVKLSLVKH
jgi:hypothetical protein